MANCTRLAGAGHDQDGEALQHDGDGERPAPRADDQTMMPGMRVAASIGCGRRVALAT